MTNQRTKRPRTLSLVLLAVAALSTVAVRSAGANPFSWYNDIAPVSIDLNGSQCPHVFAKSDGASNGDNGLYIAWTCKQWGGAWPASLNFGKFAPYVFPTGAISAVSQNDGDIFAFYVNDYQDVAYIRRNTNWPVVSLGHPAGASTVGYGPQAVAFTEGTVRKVAVFILANYQGAMQLWMQVFHGDTQAWDGYWTLVGIPGTISQNLLRQADFSVSVSSDGVNPANISAWMVANNGTFYENYGPSSGVRHWATHAKTGQYFSISNRPSSTAFLANGVIKSAAVVSNNNVQPVSYTRYNGSDAWFGPLTYGYNQKGGHSVISTTSGNRDLPTSVFIRSAGGGLYDLVEESYDYLTYPGIVDITLQTGLDNVNAEPAGLFRGNFVGPEDVFILSRAGDLLLIDGATRSKKNYGHP